MRRTLKAEVTVTVEVPENQVRPYGSDDLADAIRGAVGTALYDHLAGSPIEVIAWTVWSADT